MFYRILKNLKNSILSLHFIIGAIIGVTGYMFYLKDWVITSVQSKIDFNILEPFVYGATDKFATTISVVGLIIALSNVPFVDECNTLALYRSSRIKGILEKLLLTISITVVYCVIELLLVLIVSAPFSYIDSDWSLLMLSCGGRIYGNLKFTNDVLLNSFSPFQLTCLSFVTILTYMLIIALLLFAISLFKRRFYAFGVAVIFHATQYALHKSALSSLFFVIYDDTILESFYARGLTGIITTFIFQSAIALVCIAVSILLKNSTRLTFEEHNI